MSRPDGRIEKGQPLNRAISARAWNRAQDAADLVLGARPGFEADGIRGPSAPYTFVYCKSSVEVGRWGVVAIDGLEIPPSGPTGAATTQYEAMPVLLGGPPTDTSQSIAIAIEPIPAGGIGRVAIDGAVQAMLDVENENHRFARPRVNASGPQVESVKALQSDWAGPAQILWKEYGTGPRKWSLVRIGPFPTGVDVITNATLGPTGIQFSRTRIFVHAATGVAGVSIGVTGC